MKKYYWLYLILFLCFAISPVGAAAGNLVEPLDLGYSPNEWDLDWTALMLFGIGAVLLFIELFIPGFGICGIAGLLCFLASAYYALGASRATLIVLAIGVVVVLMLVGIVIKSLPKNPLWQRLVLKNKPQSITPQQNNLAEYTGKKGKTETLLRPSGVAIIDGERLDVVTEGEFFPAGTKIVVNKVVGNKIFVKKEN
ncbi:MAG: hypothetical protein LKJ99_00590 [Acidaminococcaceae bacterium]|jgi:membrane-bound serine protease (ClpP class)|nr:hypothetical protein [Acidaminococcaceae bacterium]